MNTLIPGAPLRSLSPTSNEYQRAEGVSRAAKPARVARFTLDAPEHSGTIPGARGDILTPGVALTSNLAVIFTLNQHNFTASPVCEEPVCGRCDVCVDSDAVREEQRAAETNPEPVRKLAREAKKVILSAVGRLRRPVGKTNLARALRGSRANRSRAEAC